MDRIKRLLEDLDVNPNLKARFDNNPIEVLEEEVQKTHPILDKKIFLIVVYIVGSALLISIIMASIIVLLYEGEVNQFFVMIASTCIGALAGLLVPTPTSV